VVVINTVQEKEDTHNRGELRGVLFFSFDEFFVFLLKSLTGGGEVSGGGTHYM
jgi:hypothetical protein